MSDIKCPGFVIDNNKIIFDYKMNIEGILYYLSKKLDDTQPQVQEVLKALVELTQKEQQLKKDFDKVIEGLTKPI